MTKRMVIAAVCLAAALGVSLFSVSFITNRTRSFIALLEQAQQIRSENGDASDVIEKTLAAWNEDRPVFAVMLKHADADELERCFIRIEEHFRHGSTELLWESVTECKAALEVVLDGELPKAENLL